MADPKHPRKFSEEFKRQIVEMYDNGKPTSEVLEGYDLGSSTFHRWLRAIHENGSTRASDNRTPEEQELIELRIKKYYVGYYTGGRKLHVSLHERKSTGNLAIGLAKTVDELEDPLGLAQDKRDVQNFGPDMPTRDDLRGAANVEAVAALISQC